MIVVCFWVMIGDMLRIGSLTRKSKDKEVVNKYGTQLLDLCKSTGMLILNGRMNEDRVIHPWWYEWQKVSWLHDRYTKVIWSSTAFSGVG